MDKIIFESFSPEETFDIAGKIAGEVRKKKGLRVVALDGELGVGKTLFAKGFAKGLGIESDILSPTFNIVKTYEGEVRLHHFDVYRISDICELDEIGFEEFIYDNAIVLVEWASSVKEALPKDTVMVEIYKDLKKGFDYRKIIVEGL